MSGFTLVRSGERPSTGDPREIRAKSDKESRTSFIATRTLLDLPGDQRNDKGYWNHTLNLESLPGIVVTPVLLPFPSKQLPPIAVGLEIYSVPSTELSTARRFYHKGISKHSGGRTQDKQGDYKSLSELHGAEIVRVAKPFASTLFTETNLRAHSAHD